MNFPLFDAHCDTLSAMLMTDQALGRNALHVDLARGANYQPWAQFFAIFGDIDPLSGKHVEGSRTWSSGEACFEAQYQLFSGALTANDDRLMLCRTAKDAKTAQLEGKGAAFLSVEGAEILECKLERLEMAHKLGVRMLTLTWNHENDLSGSSKEGAERGLTEQGVRFLRKCEELGIIVDVSHLSDKGFWDVAELSTKPFVASHSNARAVYPHIRNLTDEQFLALKKSGGVCGINLFTALLDDGVPTVDTVIAHMEHFLSLGGEKHIAIGADLDGCDSLPEGIFGIENMDKIAERLLQKNYSEELVGDIFYQNLLRVVGEVCVI